MGHRRYVKKYKFAFARKLRMNKTPQETILWEYLRLKRFNNLRFRQQAVIGGYIVDFYCPSIKLIIELDGYMHNKEKDHIRDNNLLRLGYKTIRFHNKEIEFNIQDVINSLNRQTSGVQSNNCRTINKSGARALELTSKLNGSPVEHLWRIA